MNFMVGSRFRLVSLSFLLQISLTHGLFGGPLGITTFLKQYRQTADPAEKEILIKRLESPERRILLTNPGLSVGELREVSDSTLLELIQNEKDVVVHPAILGAIDDDENVLFAMAISPDFDSRQMKEVPADVSNRIGGLRKRLAESVFQNLAPGEGCAQATIRLGQERQYQPRGGRVKES